MEAHQVGGEIARGRFVEVGFPVGREGAVHGHAGADFAGEH